MLPVWMGVLFMMIGAAGCSTGNEMVSVRLVCTDLCQESKAVAPPPFEEKTYEAEDEIAVFKRSVDKGEKMLGEVDYGVYFSMYITYKDGAQKEYDLNIVREKGYEGLLADKEEQGKVYSIPVKYHDELSRLIYE